MNNNFQVKNGISISGIPVFDAVGNLVGPTTNAISSIASSANTGINNAASASLYANTGINNAASASLYANTGITIAQASFIAANTKVNKYGDTITGPIIISNTGSGALQVAGTVTISQDLNVSGNIFLGGSTSINKAATASLHISPVGGLNSANPFWQGFQLGAEAITQSGTNVFPRASHFYSYTTVTDPTNLTYNIGTGNAGALNHNMLIYTNGGSGYLALGTSGLEKMRIDSSGNVGIGTTNPLAKLDVVGAIYSSITAAPNYILDSLGSYYGFIQNDSSNTWSLSSGTSRSTLGTPALTWNSSGNVGIGTSSPGVKLDVNGLMRATALSLSGTGVSGGTTAFSAGTVSTDTNWGMYFRTPTGSGAVAEYAWLNAAGTERMRIDSSGNVGIGTTNPACRLNVYSSTAQNDAIGFVQIENPTAAAGVNASYTAKNYSGTSQFMQWENNGLRIGSRSMTNTGLGAVVFTTGNDSERMRIDASGNVGIGTSSPSTKLEVKSASSTEAKISTDNNAYAYLTLNTWALDRAQLRGEAANPGAGSGTGSGVLSFWTANNSALAERMRIDGSGNVGIGTSSPILNSVLSIAQRNSTGNGSNTLTLDHYYANNKYIQFSWYGTNIGSISQASGTFIVIDSPALAFQTGSIDRMRIDSSGNVGIGGANYGNKLALHGGIRFLANEAAATTYTGIGSIVGDTVSISTSGSERMRIDTSGNVGIGTSSPSTYANGYAPVLAVGIGLNYAIIQGRTDGPTAATNGVSFGGSYSTNPINGSRMTLNAEGGSGQRGSVSFWTKVLDDNSTQPIERMRINSSGTLILNQGQIKFPSTQVGSADANTLDDYEEGTWTPNINGASVGSFIQKTGYYVKIGRQVTCWFRCDSGNTGAGGATQYVTGLPFNITTAINNSIMGQIGANGPATRTLDLMALNANFAVAYVYTGGSQEPTAISFAAGCFTYGID